MATNTESLMNDRAVTPVTPGMITHRNRATSTPVPEYHGDANSNRNLNDLTVSPLQLGSETTEDTCGDMTCSMSISSHCDREELTPGHIAVPIQGYEVMEERSRFSVFKIQVCQGPADTWFIFRRYSDFDHLNNQLREVFPHFRLALPPKKWFGDNFDKNFLEDRMIGLQAFLNNLVGNKEVCNSDPVREFFCFDDPPGPHDSLEECRAMCESLEERVFDLHDQVAERDSHIMLLEDELRLSQLQVDNLRKALKMERANRTNSTTSMSTTKEELRESEKKANANINPLPHVITPDSLDSSISLASSMSVIESIRLNIVPPIPEEPQAPAPNLDGIPHVKKHSGAKPKVKSGNHSSSKANQEVTSDYCSNSSHQGSTDNTSGESYLSDGIRDMTGPGKLQSSTSASSTSSSPRPKTLSMTSDERDAILPGAHSVDSASKKRTVGSAELNNSKVKTHNNNELNEVLLI